MKTLKLKRMNIRFAGFVILWIAASILGPVLYNTANTQHFLAEERAVYSALENGTWGRAGMDDIEREVSIDAAFKRIKLDKAKSESLAMNLMAIFEVIALALMAFVFFRNHAAKKALSELRSASYEPVQAGPPVLPDSFGWHSGERRILQQETFRGEAPFTVRK